MPEFSLSERIQRLKIGDGLCSPEGHHIDYVDCGLESRYPSYSITHKDDVLYLGRGYLEKSSAARMAKDTARMIDVICWPDHGARPPSEWRYEQSAGMYNPAYEFGVAHLDLPHHDWFFAPSPHTDALASAHIVPVGGKEYAEWHAAKDEVVSIERGGYDEAFYMLSRVYALKQRNRQAITLVQLKAIELKLYAHLKDEDVWRAGFATSKQIDAEMHRRHGGGYDVKRMWVLYFAPVPQTVGEYRQHDAPRRAVVHQRTYQMSLWNEEGRNQLTGKYHNKATFVDGIRFASGMEAARYNELKLLLQAGEISNLRLQPRYELHPKFVRGGKTIAAIEYVADFEYVEDGKVVVEDVKGAETGEWKLKRKMFLHRYRDLTLRVSKTREVIDI